VTTPPDHDHAPDRNHAPDHDHGSDHDPAPDHGAGPGSGDTAHHDPACDVAHAPGPPARPQDRHLVAVYASAVAAHLLAWARELGYTTVLLEPDPSKVTRGHRAATDIVLHDPANVGVTDHTDVVVTDHHRDDLGATMAPLVQARPRWIGIMGSPRHAGPHGPALAAKGLDPELVATVRRPIGLDIGSKAPAEIALSTLAELLADRNGRDGGRFVAPGAADGGVPLG
jgi:xanthine dehydrogenase accessory factor